MSRLPRRLALYVSVCLVALPVALAAQSISVVSPQQCVWRYGDNPAWAAPGLNESGWKPYSTLALIRSRARNIAEPRIWVRCRADLSSLRDTAHPAIQVTLQAAYQLYLSGQEIGAAGNLRSGNYSMNSIRSFPLPPSLLPAQPATVALRFTLFNYRSRQAVPNYPLEIHAGDSDALSLRRAGVVQEAISRPLRHAILYGVNGIVGVMLLGLFYYDRDRRELLLLSIFCVSIAVYWANNFCAAELMPYPAAVCIAVLAACSTLGQVVQAPFVYALVRRRMPLFFWILIAVQLLLTVPAAALLFLSPGPALRLAAMGGGWWGLASYLSLVGLYVAPFTAFWPYTRVARRLRPIAGLCLFWGAASLFKFAALALSALHNLHFPGAPLLPLEWEIVMENIQAITESGVLVGLLWLLFREQRQVTQERALLAGEMRAASGIQQMLAPARNDAAPGLQIDVAFRPMREVGGDFYLCRVLPDGHQRVLVGDVSGKGSAAAMAATLLLGGAAARNADSPAGLLFHLNRVMLENHLGGFATCLCADLAQDGTVTLANAGHLSPYCRGEEIAVPASLPLGLIDSSEAEYEESRFHLAPGETLTLLSDGVAEARNKTGELFGFDRTRAISHQSADQIAAAAQRFGQQDDITVLALTRLAVGEQSTATQSATTLTAQTLATA